MASALVTMSDKAAGYVQELIKLNIDAAEGFTHAADNIESADIASAFRGYASERAANAEELKASIAYNGQEPARSGTASGTVHRWWLDLKSKVTGGGIYAVLAEAERGEDSIKHSYEKALRECAGSPVAEMLQQQYVGIQAAHDNVRDLRDAYKSA
ncbi:MAG: PA2169 family four-helix-bundle protein [Tepidisphaeraceae bacterium]